MARCLADAYLPQATDEPERSVTGLGDLFVNAKWRFYGEGDDGLHLAYQPGLSIPVGKHDDDKDLSPGLGFWTFDQRLIATLIERRWASAPASFFRSAIATARAAS
ncbi:MAG: transporter [Myxococcota bacterium]